MANSKQHLAISLKVPLASSSMFEQAETLSRLKPHIDALRDAAGDDHEYSDAIKTEREKSEKPRKARTPRAVPAAA